MLELINAIKQEIKESNKYARKIERQLEKTRKKDTYRQLQNKLKRSLKCNLEAAVGTAGRGKKYQQADLIYNEQADFRLPKNLELFIKFSDWTGFDFLGTNIDFGISNNEEIRDGIAEELYPPFLMRFLVLGSNEYGYLGMWLYADEVEDSEILLFDNEENKIHIVSKSLKNFVQRALRCYQEDVENNWFEPSEKLAEIIQDVEGEMLSIDDTGLTLDFIEGFPESWGITHADDFDVSQQLGDTVPLFSRTFIVQGNFREREFCVDIFPPVKDTQSLKWHCLYEFYDEDRPVKYVKKQIGRDGLEALQKVLSEVKHSLQKHANGKTITWQGQQDLGLGLTDDFEIIAENNSNRVSR